MIVASGKFFDESDSKRFKMLAGPGDLFSKTTELCGIIKDFNQGRMPLNKFMSSLQSARRSTNYMAFLAPLMEATLTLIKEVHPNCFSASGSGGAAAAAASPAATAGGGVCMLKK